MDYLDKFQQTIDFIEDHLNEPITVEWLAKNAGFSTYHFYKLFREYLGMSVMEYVRRRRLAYAVNDLCNGKRILDVALEYGFDTHNGFSKAFRKCYGCSPEFYRDNHLQYIPKKANLKQLKKFAIPHGIIKEPIIVQKSSFYVAGYALHTSYEENKQVSEIRAFWNNFGIDGLEQKIYDIVQPLDHGEYCISFPPDYSTNEFTYVIGVKPDKLNNLPPDLFVGEVPEATYAVFTTPRASYAKNQFANAIRGTWRYIYEIWFPNSGYELAEGKVEYEFYDERCHEEVGAVMEIYIPIEKKIREGDR